MPDTNQQLLTTTSTVALNLTPSQQEPDSTTNTQLEQAFAQKVATDESSIQVREFSSVLGGCMPESHYLNGQDKMVQFKGLYVVRGPTESKHVRYTMEITVAELELHGRCIQRFQSFFLLRKRLLEVLKTCRGRLPSRKSTLTQVNNEPQLSAGAELVGLLTRPRCIQCPECESTHDQLAAVKFPYRTLFPPSLQDAQERSQTLETFLDYCVRIATTWPACQRSKRLFNTALGKFLGIDLKAYLDAHEGANAVSKAGAVISVSTHDTEEQQNDPAEAPSTSDAGSLPMSHDEDEHLHSGNYEDDCRSEPNFSFISSLPKEGGMVRSKSYC